MHTYAQSEKDELAEVPLRASSLVNRETARAKATTREELTTEPTEAWTGLYSVTALRSELTEGLCVNQQMRSSSAQQRQLSKSCRASRRATTQMWRDTVNSHCCTVTQSCKVRRLHLELQQQHVQPARWPQHVAEAKKKPLQQRR